MISNSLNFFKLLAILSFFFLGIILMLDGFKILIKDQKKITENTKNNFKSNIKITTKLIDSPLQNEILENVKVKKNTRYNEIKLIVKKNDTFSKLIDPFFNNKMKNKIINKVNEKINLKILTINQKIFLYEDNKKNIIKLILPKNFETD